MKDPLDTVSKDAYIETYTIFYFFWFRIHKLARQLHQERTQMEVQ